MKQLKTRLEIKERTINNKKKEIKDSIEKRNKRIK